MYDVTALFLPFLSVIVFPRHTNIYICLETVGFMLLGKCLILGKKSAGHCPQILKLVHLIEYLIKNIFMEKVCRRPAVKTSSIYLFNLVNSPKQLNARMRFLKRSCFEKRS